MISQKEFNNLELEHGCGYWNLCYEHACPCAITVEHKGLRQNIWDGMVKENREVAEEYEKECERNSDNYYYEKEDDPYDDFDWEYDLDNDIE